MTEVVITTTDVPVPIVTKKVFRIHLSSEDEAEIDKIIASIKAAVPDATIKDGRTANP